jgi:hypothetical protein
MLATLRQGISKACLPNVRRSVSIACSRNVEVVNSHAEGDNWMKSKVTADNSQVVYEDVNQPNKISALNYLMAEILLGCES